MSFKHTRTRAKRWRQITCSPLDKIGGASADGLFAVEERGTLDVIARAAGVVGHQRANVAEHVHRLLLRHAEGRVDHCEAAEELSSESATRNASMAHSRFRFGDYDNLSITLRFGTNARSQTNGCKISARMHAACTADGPLSQLQCSCAVVLKRTPPEIPKIKQHCAVFTGLGRVDADFATP
jgi:hypothetical protein